MGRGKLSGRPVETLGGNLAILLVISSYENRDEKTDKLQLGRPLGFKTDSCTCIIKHTSSKCNCGNKTVEVRINNG